MSQLVDPFLVHGKHATYSNHGCRCVACKEDHAAVVKAWRVKTGKGSSREGFMAGRRQYIVDIKMTSGCLDCGYNEHPDALEFDHLPGTEKLFNIGNSGSVSQERLDAEIAKCEVVCATCHRVRTASRRKANLCGL